MFAEDEAVGAQSGEEQRANLTCVGDEYAIIGYPLASMVAETPHPTPAVASGFITVDAEQSMFKHRKEPSTSEL
jgi:hypothetical protein